MLNFIYNPTAGGGRSLKYQRIISDELIKRNIPHAFHKTFFKNHATEIAKQLTTAGCREIVVIGGDGTLHEVLNGLENIEDVTLGLIPCGSGNDFATVAKIPFDPLSALDVVLASNSRHIDYMECSGVRGINIIGTGIDVEILKRCYESKILKGKIKYLISTLISLIAYKCKPVEVHTDSSASSHNVFIACAGNGAYFGGGIPMSPKSDFEDGQIDFVLVNNMKWYKKGFALFDLLKGKILENKSTLYKKTTRAHIVSDSAVTIEIDGEIYENLKFDVSIVHNKLRMFFPGNADTVSAE